MSSRSILATSLVISREMTANTCAAFYGWRCLLLLLLRLLLLSAADAAGGSSRCLLCCLADVLTHLLTHLTDAAAAVALVAHLPAASVAPLVVSIQG